MNLLKGKEGMLSSYVWAAFQRSMIFAALPKDAGIIRAERLCLQHHPDAGGPTVNFSKAPWLNTYFR